MKKKLIAVAIATAFAAPAFADNSNVEVYGKINVDVESVKNDKAVAPSSAVQMTNNASRFGVKGKEDLGDGLNAIWQYEVQVDATGSTGKGLGDSTRNTRVGLEGGFGTIFFGNWDTPYKVAHNKVEIFDNAGSFSAGKLIGVTTALALANNTQGATYLTANSYVTRQSSDIQYWTPKLNGLQGFLSYTPGTKTATTNPTRLSVSGVYDDNGIYGALAYESRPDQNKAGVSESATRLVGAYAFDAAQIGLTYERITSAVSAATSASQNNWELSGKYKFGASTIGAFYANNGNLGSNANTGAKMYSLRYGYNFSKRTELWAAYSQLKNDANAAYGFYKGNALVGAAGTNPANTGSTDSGFGLGLSHTF